MRSYTVRGSVCRTAVYAALVAVATASAGAVVAFVTPSASRAPSRGMTREAASAPRPQPADFTTGRMNALSWDHPFLLQRPRSKPVPKSVPKPVAKPAPAARPVAPAPLPTAASRSTVRVSLDPRVIAQGMLAQRGWSGQWGCLNALWTRESNWQVYAQNPYSGAYGIPQALPGYKMASAGWDWRTNPVTQISWGLSYIASTYGTPCGAWAHSLAYNYY